MNKGNGDGGDGGGMKPGVWFVPLRVVALQDREGWFVFPGKPVRRGSAAQVSRAVGVSKRVLHALADAGFVRRARPSPTMSLFYFGEVEGFIRRTEDEPEFWDKVKQRAYLTGRGVKGARRG